MGTDIKIIITNELRLIPKYGSSLGMFYEKKTIGFHFLFIKVKGELYRRNNKKWK